MTKQNQVDALILYALIPYRICSESVLLSLEQDGITRDTIQRSLVRLQQSRHLRKLVLVERGMDMKWSAVEWSRANASERQNGNVVYQISEDGFQYLRYLFLRIGEAPPLLNDFPLPFTDCKWGRKGSRSDTFNTERNKQSVVVMLRQAGVSTPSEPRAVPPAQRSREATVQTFSDALEDRITELSTQPHDYLSVPHFFLKPELFSSNNIQKDNMIGALINGSNIHAVYHTTSPLGTRWHTHVKGETILTLEHTAAALGIDDADTSAAILVYTREQEVRDLVMSCHGAKVRRSFLRLDETGYDNPAAPFDHLYLVPESSSGLSQISQILLSPEKDTFLRVLKDQLYRAKLNGTVDKTIALLQRGSRTPTLNVPSDDAEYAAFSLRSFPYSLSSDVTGTIPVLLGYDLDLSVISSAYYWVYKTDRIGTAAIGDEIKRSLLIACYPWQQQLLQTLFPDAIYSASLTH